MAGVYREQWQAFKKKNPDFEKSGVKKQDLGPALDALEDKVYQFESEQKKLDDAVNIYKSAKEKYNRELQKAKDDLEKEESKLNSAKAAFAKKADALKDHFQSVKQLHKSIVADLKAKKLDKLAKVCSNTLGELDASGLAIIVQSSLVRNLKV